MNASLEKFEHSREGSTQASMANFRKMISNSAELQEQIRNGADMVELGRKNGFFDILVELRLIQRSREFSAKSAAEREYGG